MTIGLFMKRIIGALAAYAVAFAASAGVCSADMMKNTDTPFWHYMEVMYVVYSIAIPITIFFVIANIFLLFSKNYKNYSLGGRVLGLLSFFVGLLTLFMVVGVVFYVIAVQVMADYNPWKARAERKERKLDPPGRQKSGTGENEAGERGAAPSHGKIRGRWERRILIKIKP